MRVSRVGSSRLDRYLDSADKFAPVLEEYQKKHPESGYRILDEGGTRLKAGAVRCRADPEAGSARRRNGRAGVLRLWQGATAWHPEGA
jgi:hypothetical protein